MSSESSRVDGAAGAGTPVGGPALTSGENAVALSVDLTGVDSAQWLRVTLSSIGDGVVIVGPQGTVTFLNPVAQALTGWSQADAFGHPLSEVFHIVNESSRAHVENPAVRALRDGTIVGLANHTVLIARDGSERHIDDSAAPIRNAEGETRGAILVFRDISERRRSERALHNSEVRYRRLFQTAKDGILILDATTGKIIDANAFMSALIGVEPHDLIGKELFELGMFGDVEANKAAFQELQRARYLRQEHLPLKNTRGQRVEVEFIANVYLEGDVLVAQCNIRDISQRVAMEKRIEQQAAELSDNSRRKDEFLAMLSHELRNPLAPIRTAVHLLRLQAGLSETPLQRQAREIIERQVGNLTKLIGDLLEVSRVINGRVRLDILSIDLKQVVRHGIDTVLPLIQRHRHTLTVNLGDEDFCVNADATRLEEVFINILTNAAKYTPDTGTIEIVCERVPDENSVAVRVRDNGVGIEPALLPHIFDLFSQAQRSLDRSQGGLGIGLSLAHTLVGLHGGSIEVFSPPPGATTLRGSEFVVKLPLVAERLSPLSPSVVTAPAGPKGGLRVLIIDDNVDLATILSTMLRASGHEVFIAHDGAKGQAALSRHRPDVCIIDIGLPIIDGYELARRVRADGANAAVRLIAMSGYGRDSDILLAKQAGFERHLLKPIEFGDLERILSEAALPRAPQ